MVDLVAYVKGDITATTEVISQVVLVTKSADYLDALQVAMLAGFMIGLIRGLFKGGKLDLVAFFMPIFIYLIGVVPTANLVITNDRTGAISKIDDVPMVIAAPVHLVTTVGHGISRRLEDSLGLADKRITTDNSALVSVRAPLAYNEIVTNKERLGDAGQNTNGVDILNDAEQYVEDCVTSELKFQNVTHAQLISNPIDTAFQSTALDSISTPSGTYTCASLWILLNEAMDSTEFLDAIPGRIDEIFGRYAGDTDTGARYRTALQSLVPDEGDFIKSLVWMHAMDKGYNNLAAAGGGGTSAAAISDALSHRLQNSRGQAEIVFETMSMTISFIEAWSFAIMPLMILVLVFGTLGWGLATKYFWLLIWIQLWHPTILIVVDFMEGQSSSMAASASASIAQTAAFLEQSMRLEDIGYLMLSMATMLSMFIIYGSSSVFGTQFNSALSGRDFYDEKKVIPDTLRNEPYWVNRPSFESSDAGGSLGVYAADAFGTMTFSVDHSLASGVNMQAAAARSRSDTDTTGESYTDHTQFSNQHILSTRETLTFGNQVTESQGVSLSEADTVGDGTNVGSTTEISGGNLFTNQFSTSANAGLPIRLGPSAGSSLGISGVESSQNRDQVGTSLRFSEEITKRTTAGASQQKTDTFTNDSAIGTSESQIDSVGRTRQAGNSQENTQSRSETFARSHSDMVQRRVSTGQLNGFMVANNIAGNNSLFEQMVSTVQTAGLSDEVENMLQQNEERFAMTFPDGTGRPGKMNEDAAYAFASLYVLQGMGSSLTGRTEEQRQTLNAIGDEFIEAATFNDSLAVSGVDTRHISEGSINADTTTPFNTLAATFGLSQEGFGNLWDEELSSTENIGTMADRLKGVSDRFEGLTDGNINGAFSIARGKLEAQTDQLTDKSGPLGFAFHGNLDWDAVQNGLNPFADAQQTDLNRLENDFTAFQGESAAATLQNKEAAMSHVVGASQNDTGARYLTLAQLTAGAIQAGDLSQARSFKASMDQLVTDDEIAPDIAAQLNTLALSSTSENGIARRVDLANAWADYGELRSEFEANRGWPIRDDGGEVSWGTPTSDFAPGSVQDGIHRTANDVGIDPMVLATVISYETGGTFDPLQPGPTTQHGQHRGFIQFGEPQARAHGVDWSRPIESQLGPGGAVADYLLSRGVKPGMGLLEVYSAVNAGGIGEEYFGRTDYHNGGMPGTVRDKVNSREMAAHLDNARRFMAM